MTGSPPGRAPVDHVNSISTSSGRNLVDRYDELDLLDRISTESSSGRPRLVTIEGIAGVGKSALVDEALRRSMSGATVLRARGGGPRAVPYLPIAMALRSLDRGGDTVARLLDGAPQDVAVEIGLVDAVFDCLMHAARQRRLALVLEDLDRSDTGTVALLTHLGMRLGDQTDEPARLLVMCTFRPRAPDGTGPDLHHFAEASMSSHLLLHPLSEPGVLKMLTDLVDGKPSRALLREVLDASQGLPGRVHRLVSTLAAAGDLVDRAGEVDLGAASVVVPADDDDVQRVDALLAAMDPTHRDLVVVAALMGAGRPLDELRAALAMDATLFETGLDVAFTTGCLVDHDDRIVFADPSTAEALLHRIRPRQQRILHARIAANLTASGAAVTGGRIALVAHHLAEAGPSGPQYQELFEVGRAAGALAMANGDYSSAARFFEAALASDRGRAAEPLTAMLHLEAGIAHFRDHDSAAALTQLQFAVDGSREGGDTEVWGRAVLALCTVLTVHSNQAIGHDVGLDHAREFLDAGVATGHDLRARVLQRMSQAQFASFAFEAALATAEQAAAAADGSIDPTLHGDVQFARGIALIGTLHVDDAAVALRQSVRHAVAADDPWIKASALGRIPFVAWMQGHLAAAESAVHDALSFDRATRNWSEWSLAAATAAGLALARGDYGGAERHGCEAELLYRRSESGFTTVILYPALACARALRGENTAAHDALDSWAATGVFGSDLFRTLVDAYDGVPQSGGDLHGIVSSGVHLVDLTLAALSVELGDAIDDEQLLAQGLPPLVSAIQRGVLWCPGWSFFLPRLVAVASWRLGKDDAEHLFERACALATRTRAVGELARCRSDAAAFWSHRDSDRAAVLDAKARVVFAELGSMALLRRRRDPVTAGWMAQPPTLRLPERTFFFSDVVDSTGLTRRLGIERYTRDWLAAHDSIVRGCLRERNGVDFKHTGDGIAAWFNSEVDAVSCSLEVQRRLVQFNAHHLGEPLRVRIGLSLGEVVIDGDGQPQGLALIRARRLCDLAHADQVLVSDEIARRTNIPNFRFQAVGEFVLKGFAQLEVVHLVTLSSTVHRRP